MLRPLNVAMPLTAVAVAVPLRTPEFGLVPMVTVTDVELSLVTTFPSSSRRLTVTAGVIVAFDAALVGCWTKATWVAGLVMVSICVAESRKSSGATAVAVIVGVPEFVSVYRNVVNPERRR